MGAFLSVITYLACCGKRDVSSLPRHRQDVTVPSRREHPATMREKQLGKAEQKQPQREKQGQQKRDKEKQEQQQQQGTGNPETATTTSNSKSNTETTDSDASDSAATDAASSIGASTSSSPPSISDSSTSSPNLNPTFTSKPTSTSHRKPPCPDCPPSLLYLNPSSSSTDSALALLPPTNSSPSSWESHHPAKHTRWMIFVSRYLWSVWQWPRYELETTRLFANEPGWALQKRVSQDWKAHMDAQLQTMLEQPWRMWDPVPLQGDPNVDYGLARRVMRGHLEGGV